MIGKHAAKGNACLHSRSATVLCALLCVLALAVAPILSFANLPQSNEVGTEESAGIPEVELPELSEGTDDGQEIPSDEQEDTPDDSLLPDDEWGGGITGR